MRRRALLLAPLLALAFAFSSGLGCGASTRLTAVWVPEAAPPGGVRDVLVLGIGRTPTERRLFEDRFASALREHGVAATASYRLLPSDERLTERELREAVRSGEHDAVVLARLLAVDRETTYVPPSAGVSVGYAGGPWGYYGHGWGVTRSPGYVKTTTIVRLETRLYGVADEALLWSAQSDTFSPSSAAETVESVTRAVVKRLVADGFLPR